MVARAAYATRIARLSESRGSENAGNLRHAGVRATNGKPTRVRGQLALLPDALRNEMRRLSPFPTVVQGPGGRACRRCRSDEDGARCGHAVAALSRLFRHDIVKPVTGEPPPPGKRPSTGAVTANGVRSDGSSHTLSTTGNPRNARCVYTTVSDARGRIRCSSEAVKVQSEGRTPAVQNAGIERVGQHVSAEDSIRERAAHITATLAPILGARDSGCPLPHQTNRGGSAPNAIGRPRHSPLNEAGVGWHAA
jgi:hypothetical protein